jgi:putative metalloprotease
LGHVALGHAKRRMIDFSGQNALRTALTIIISRFIPFVGVYIAAYVTSILAAGLSRADEYAADERSFIPHITLAYLQKTPEALVAAKVAELQDLRCEPHMVESFNLYSSDTALGEANLYRVAARYPSAGS